MTLPLSSSSEFFPLVRPLNRPLRPWDDLFAAALVPALTDNQIYMKVVSTKQKADNETVGADMDEE